MMVARRKKGGKYLKKLKYGAIPMIAQTRTSYEIVLEVSFWVNNTINSLEPRVRQNTTNPQI